MNEKLRLEKWHSTENRHECHFFLADGLAAGYQESAYVFGYNPELITPKVAQQMFDLAQTCLEVREDNCQED